VTITYDPFHPRYFDEADLREELTRVYDLCHGCRRCFTFCDAFPSLFEMIEEHDDQGAARLTPAQQDRVVHKCFQCKLCYVNCPYIPGQSEWELDFPRLMMRAEQVLHRTGKKPVSAKLTDQTLGRTDLVGKVSTTLSPVVNKAIGTPGSTIRKAIEKTVGVASERILPPFNRERFTTWFKNRTASCIDEPAATVALFPTCIVEYQNAAIGHDTVKVYERNGIECSLPEGQVCCGAPLLHQGNVDAFVKQGGKNVQVLAKAVRAGRDVVVPQPTCSYILKRDYPDYIGGTDAELVADHTFDAAEYLMKVHKERGLDTDFEGFVPASVTYHAPCHLRAQNIGFTSRDLLELTGTKITVVAECSAVDGTWGLRAENYEMSRQVAQKMAAAIEAADSEAIAGDCNLANGAIVQETRREPLHPLQVMARAYGVAEETIATRSPRREPRRQAW
jgi:glycerol-3-phosphate dehydrogenase subunit C